MNPYRYDIFFNAMLDRTERFIGLHEELEGLLARVSGTRPAAISLVGPWGIGKSFNLRFLADPRGARRVFAHALGERFRSDPDRLCFVLLDLEQHSSPEETAQQFLDLLYTQLLGHLAELFAIPDARLLPLEQLPREAQRSVADLRGLVQRRLTQTLEEADTTELYERFDAFLGATLPERLLTLLRQLAGWGLRIVFLIDNFDTIAPQLDQADFDHLRTILASASMVIATRQALSRLVTDAAQSSPFFNLLEKLNLMSLHFLSQAEAQRLIIEPPSWFEASADVVFSPADVAFILELTGTHPDIVRASCEFLFTWIRRNKNLAPPDLVPPAEYPYLRARLRALFADSFAVLWHRLEPDERAELQRIASSSTGASTLPQMSITVLGKLIERGYVVSDQGHYRLFSGLFQDYVQEQMGSVPTTELPPLKTTLTDLEQKFLDLLREQPGQVVDRDLIVRSLYAVNAGENNLKSYYSRLDALIFRLRNKLEGESLIIENFRGQGYRLVLTR